MPEVSVIIPTFNSEKYILDAVNSVICQTFVDFELIVVDDASDDRTIETVSLIKDPRIKIFPQTENHGAGHARNFGIKKATGVFIAFLDSDDLWLPNKLSQQISFMKKNNILSCYTQYMLIDSDGNTFSESGKLSQSLSYNQLLSYNQIRTSSYVYNANALGKVYFPTIRKRQDFGLFLDVTKRSGKSFLFDCETVKYRVRSDSLSGKKISNITFQWKFYRDCVGLNLFRSSALMFSWFLIAGSIQLKRIIMKHTRFIRERRKHTLR